MGTCCCPCGAIFSFSDVLASQSKKKSRKSSNSTVTSTSGASLQPSFRCHSCGTLVQLPVSFGDEVMFTRSDFVQEDGTSIYDIDTRGENALNMLISGSGSAVTLDTVGPNVDQRAIEEALCEHCNKVQECYTYAQQTRGADEGQTIFFQCKTCKNEWSLSS